MQISSTTLPPFSRTTDAPANAAPAAANTSAPAAKARSPRQAVAELQINIVTSRDDLAGIAPEWNALFERAGRPHHVFQTHGFADLWARTWLAKHHQAAAAEAAHRLDTCSCRLAIVTAWRDNRLVLVWPMVTVKQMGLTVLTWLGEPVAQYGDALADPAEPLLPMLRKAWSRVTAALKPDLVRLRKVRADATIAPFLTEAVTTTSEHVEAPCITLALGGSPFEERQSGKAKKNRRRLARRLEETGAVSFKVHASGSTSAAAAAVAGLDAKRDWLLRRALLSPALADKRVDAFFADATTSYAQATGARVFSLQLDDRPIAIAIGFACKRRLMLHLITQTDDVERFGAGVLNLEALLRQAEAEGFEAVDMLPPKADYKLDWADTTVAVADHVLGLTTAGKLWARAFDGFARPQMKRAIEALPEPVRRHMAARALVARRTKIVP